MKNAKIHPLLQQTVSSGRACSEADLHVHTTISDGSDTCVEVLGKALRQGVFCLALTNHDTTAELDEAIVEGARCGVEVIGGIEISAFDSRSGRKVHVLGYDLVSDSPAVEALCSPLLRRRDANTRWQLRQLLAAGYSVNLDRVEELAASSTALYKQHLMAALTDEVYGSGAYVDLYRSLFKNGGLCARDIEYVDARDAVRAITADGGVAVLAHPGQLGSYEIVEELVELGLWGVEKYHPDHTPSDWFKCDNLAQSYNLVCTGGSDYHGLFGSSPYLGCVALAE